MKAIDDVRSNKDVVKSTFLWFSWTSASQALLKNHLTHFESSFDVSGHPSAMKRYEKGAKVLVD